MTGYVVHYSDGDRDVTESVLDPTYTSHVITDLASGILYNFSVEATSQHLSGESAFCEIVLGNLFNPSTIPTINKHYRRCWWQPKFRPV